MRFLKYIFPAAAFIICVTLFSCNKNNDNGGGNGTGTNIISTENVFAKGADVSWITELEKEGNIFYDSTGVATECMALLKEYGVNAIRLRVWVDPSEGWNNAGDVLVKARRAAALGLDVMIDFHYSDTWADPGNQKTPAAWADFDMDELKKAVADHTSEMMNMLMAYGVEPKWVQVGNETRGGMLYPLGSYKNGQNYADLVNAGYNAVKKVFPNAMVIIHIDSGDNISLYNRIFGVLKIYGGEYDMIGMSLYPEADGWQTPVNTCIANINTLYKTYGKPVMICEVGMDYDKAEECRAFLTDLKNKAKNNTGGECKGIFYWEPEAPVGYNGGYKKGCFVNGTPTEALDAFKN
ncbi:MAG: arabinogalactan endo-1,4-beta-galactosidase [Bacteroidales bacterium]|jgi:arabinogalactan endo-1,4-beta-galactosidase|nr:arabinogalactan endo-1,4-beta-galactosidase [Bacteroidales bacterium]